MNSGYPAKHQILGPSLTEGPALSPPSTTNSAHQEQQQSENIGDIAKFLEMDNPDSDLEDEEEDFRGFSVPVQQPVEKVGGYLPNYAEDFYYVKIIHICTNVGRHVASTGEGYLALKRYAQKWIIITLFRSRE